MAVTLQDVFSFYDCPKAGFKFDGEQATIVTDTLAKLDESMEIKVITKNKRNLSWKEKAQPTGKGELTLAIHITNELRNKLYGLSQSGLKANAGAYGTTSRHGKFLFTCLLEDEDGNQMLKAYPNCQVTSGLTENLSANGDTIEEVEITISVTPDENGNSEYRLLMTENEKTVTVDAWISTFSTSMVEA